MRYPGGKNVSGVYQFIINQIPPHRVYIETHLGSGAILRNKKLAEINIGIDIDPAAIKSWSDKRNVMLFQEDAISFLNQYDFKGDEFVYVDPPYIKTTRQSKRNIYRYEYTDEQHIELLTFLVNLECNVMISGYLSEQYTDLLRDWRSVEYQVRNRAGKYATEYLWMNYPEAKELHDYQYLGNSFRERERIRRRNLRWKEKLVQLPQLERNALLEQLKVI